jgi:hypothetical protein
MNFYQYTEYGLKNVDRSEAQIVHISEYEALEKQIAELKKSQAWGVFHFTKEEMTIHNLNKSIEGLREAKALAQNVGYSHRVAIELRIQSMEKQLKVLEG